MAPGLLAAFLLAIAIGYYYDYRKNIEDYKEKSQGVLYLVAIGAILLLLILTVL